MNYYENCFEVQIPGVPHSPAEADKSEGGGERLGITKLCLSVSSYFLDCVVPQCVHWDAWQHNLKALLNLCC